MPVSQGKEAILTYQLHNQKNLSVIFHCFMGKEQVPTSLDSVALLFFVVVVLVF